MKLSNNKIHKVLSWNIDSKTFVIYLEPAVHPPLAAFSASLLSVAGWDLAVQVAKCNQRATHLLLMRLTTHWLFAWTGPALLWVESLFHQWNKKYFSTLISIEQIYMFSLFDFQCFFFQVLATCGTNFIKTEEIPGTYFIKIEEIQGNCFIKTEEILDTSFIKTEEIPGTYFKRNWKCF